jgi:hypothetical protein
MNAGKGWPNIFKEVTRIPFYSSIQNLYYVVEVIANPDVARHIILEKSFLEFQVKSFSSSLSRIVKLEILLPDGRPVFVECCSDDPTNAVMEVCFGYTVGTIYLKQFFRNSAVWLSCPRSIQNSLDSSLRVLAIKKMPPVLRLYTSTCSVS